MSLKYSKMEIDQIHKGCNAMYVEDVEILKHAITGVSLIYVHVEDIIHIRA